MMPPLFIFFSLNRKQNIPQTDQLFGQGKEIALIFIFSNQAGEEGRKANATNTIQSPTENS